MNFDMILQSFGKVSLDKSKNNINDGLDSETRVCILIN